MATSQSQHSPEYSALLDVHQDLCNALPINDLFPGLISRRVISVADKEKLCLGKIERESAELFLEKHLHPQLLAGDTKRFYDFIATMEESPKCSFAVKKIKDRITVHQSETTSTTAASTGACKFNLAAPDPTTLKKGSWGNSMDLIHDDVTWLFNYQNGCNSRGTFSLLPRLHPPR